ncbi:MAG: RidA family protein [Dehalococcoidia bacterium]|nr:RidA family protein [Dehalococcoidia bacterium]
MSFLKRRPLYYGNVKQPYASKSADAVNLLFLYSFDGRPLTTGAACPDSIESQVTNCLDNIRLALVEAGSSLDNLVKNHIFVKNYLDCPRVWKTMLDYFQKHAPQLVEEPPAAAVCQIDTMAKPECLVEIDSIAVLSKDKPGWEMKRYPIRLRRLGGRKQVYPDIEPGMPFLSESVVVGNLVFVSAMGGENPETGKIETGVFEEQMHTALDKVRAAMDNAGSSLSNIIKTLHFQTRLETLLTGSKDSHQTFSTSSDRLWKAELEYYDRYAPFLLDEFPASTFMKVSSLADPVALAQVDVTGVVSRFKPGWRVRNCPCYLAKRGFPGHIGDIRKYYANSVVVGNLIFFSGQCPFDPVTGGFESNNFEEQMVLALDNLRAGMEEAGSSLENLVKTNILLPNPSNLASMRRIEQEYYRKYAPRLIDEPPASSVIHLLKLAAPNLMIEIDAIGCIPLD